MRRSCVVVGVIVAGFAWFHESKCYGFNETTHRRIVETAANVMENVEFGTVPIPPGVGGAVIAPESWASFLARLKVTNARLATMRTGLTGAYKGGTVRDVMDPQAVPPHMSPPDSIAAQTRNNPAICGYNKVDAVGRELNLINAGRIAIRDFPYYPSDEYSPCAYTSLPATLTDNRAERIGAVLGWHAASIDWRTSDSATWLRPTNSAGAGGLVTETLSRGFEYFLGSLLVPIVCFKEFWDTASLDECRAFDLAKTINPVEYMEGLLPGIPVPGSNEFVGMWHFIDVNASSPR